MRFDNLVLSGLVMLSLSGCGAASITTVPEGLRTEAIQAAPAAPADQPAAESSTAPAAASSAPAASRQDAASAPAVPAAEQPSNGTQQPAASAAAPVGPAVTPTPATFRLQPLQYIRQTLNNCGPAAIAEVLHYWGVDRTQAQTQAVLRPDANSRGMMPYPVPAYVHGLGMNALMGVGGNPTIVKALVTNGFPVIVAQNVSLAEPIAHYREIEGFDDSAKTFVSTDSYLGPNHEIGYAEFDQLWARGNQRFMVVYPPAKEPLLNAVLKSAGWDKTAAYQKDLARQQRGEITVPDPNAFRPNFPGASQLNQAWDYIQLGQLDAARSAIQQAPASPRNAQLIDWLKGAMAVAAS